MAVAKQKSVESVKKVTSIGKSVRSVPKSKHQKRMKKPYRGQGKP